MVLGAVGVSELVRVRVPTVIPTIQSWDQMLRLLLVLLCAVPNGATACMKNTHEADLQTCIVCGDTRHKLGR